MITVKPDTEPTLRVEVYRPSPHKPAWARDQLSRLMPFEEWRAQGNRSTADCLEYWKMIAMLEAIGRGETIYLLEDKSAQWAAQKSTAA